MRSGTEPAGDGMSMCRLMDDALSECLAGSIVGGGRASCAKWMENKPGRRYTWSCLIVEDLFMLDEGIVERGHG